MRDDLARRIRPFRLPSRDTSNFEVNKTVRDETARAHSERHSGIAAVSSSGRSEKKAKSRDAVRGELSVLNVGAGYPGENRLHPLFKSRWREVRLDIDPAVNPDVICSASDMSAVVEDSSFDAIWCSHNLEHLAAHEVVPALKEFNRVLKPTGFLLLRSPDLESIAETILKRGLDEVVYESPAGPITALDMLYGHGRSIENGNEHMRHGTGFTRERIGRLLIEAGFWEARTTRSETAEVWALAWKQEANGLKIVKSLLNFGPDFQI